MTEKPWSPPAELTKPVPRRVRSDGVLIGVFSVLAGLFAFIAIVFGVVEFSRVQHLRGLVTRGIAAKAEVIKVYNEKSKRFEQDVIDLSYVSTDDKSESKSVFVHGIFISTDMIKAHNIKVGSIVPIFYDPLDFYQVEINYGKDMSYINPKLLSYDLSLEKILLISFGVISIFILGIYMKRRGAKRILQSGTAAEATIISEEKYEMKSGQYSTISYKFVDNNGETHHGSVSWIPLPNEGESDPWGRRAKILSHRTVVYNPLKPSQNLLYPPEGLEIR